MFVGRKNELSALENLYSTDKFEMVVIYGRRRIGKTTLISKFVENKPAIFYSAQEANDKTNLDNFSRKIYEFTGIPISTGSFNTWNDALDFLAEKAKNDRIVLAFDEFPYAANGNKALKSILQNSIDHKLKDTKIFLILCGSQIAFMERDVLGAKSPLFGRRTAQIKLEGFNYLDSALLLDGISNSEKIKYYACIGGTPHYLAQINKSISFEQNIKKLFFDISGYLYNEPMMLLQQELREPAMYNSIIGTIASGATKLNEIATKISEDRAKVYKYLNTLVNMKLIKKDIPFGEDPESSRKGIYKIDDNCYSFWYRFVFPNKPEIENGSGSIIADSLVFNENLNAYIGKNAFEEICKQYLIIKNQKKELPFIVTSFGNWWGNDNVKRVQTDIDCVAGNKIEKKLILVECKYKDDFNEMRELKELIEKSYLFPKYKKKYHYFFSKNQLSLNAQRFAEENNIKLVTEDDLFYCG